MKLVCVFLRNVGFFFARRKHIDAKRERETNIRLLDIFHSVVDACSHFGMHTRLLLVTRLIVMYNFFRFIVAFAVTVAVVVFINPNFVNFVVLYFGYIRF